MSEKQARVIRQAGQIGGNQLPVAEHSNRLAVGQRSVGWDG